jgi:SnoaL-like polyketide cyclase
MSAGSLAGRESAMSVEVVRDLFDRWERVWHEEAYDLVAGCVAPVYVRHDDQGTRRVKPAEYAAELAANRRQRPNTRIVVYDHALSADRAWYRFALMWDDAATGDKRTRAGLQAYRIEDGKLAETWLTLLPLGSAWPDLDRQESWTSPRKTAAAG